ncbi:MAG TPA: alpha/beta hydrolase-fold protein [Actinophytocola sp.]|uniref:alpha/beta hydrolase-fold protein n=1 Tax=Actinophytocola sp. TaxID=1872138 RepID=UPI002DB96D89|nr:alpha/beta hydrolase-fold protein [Actinophytocola sp.]HEU5473436.1 alpha/beta hydrolase-fold protein [Actinophytocola sp.]
MFRKLGFLAAMLVVVLAAGTVTGQADTGGRRSYTGTIDGADYRVEVPDRWNGTLVLFSHPYYPEGLPAFGIGLSLRAETETWLLGHGYALAGSDFQGRTGAVYDRAPVDQLALLDWFDSNVGHPRRTVASGQSMGAALSVLLAERNPGRFDGVLAMCGPLDLNGSWNISLDVTFAISTLLAPGQDIELVRPSDPAGSAAALRAAVAQALTTPAGRARLALAGAVGNVPDWYSAHQPRPTALVDRIQALAAAADVYVSTFGPTGRVDLERRAGGNPSWNIGIDYRHQFARSAGRDLVAEAYRAAGLDLDADLNRLGGAPRIAPDPAALGWMYRFGVPRGSTPVPVLTLHNTADVAGPDHERWYAGQVARHGDPARLRQLFVGRATHCAFSAAEEIVALRTLLTRIEAGSWPNTAPGRLNSAAVGLGADFQLVFDFPTFVDAPRPPAFTAMHPPVFLRPST